MGKNALIKYKQINIEAPISITKFTTSILQLSIIKITSILKISSTFSNFFLIEKTSNSNNKSIKMNNL